MEKLVLTLVITLIGMNLMAQSVADRRVIAPQFEYHPTPKKTVRTLAIKEAVKPALKWKAMTHSFGKINYNQPVTAVFEFVNISDQVLMIKDAKGSCGCTGTTFPKTAILPGETAQITATYDAKNIGPFKQTVTVYTNVDEDKGTVLDITGEVIWRL